MFTSTSFRDVLGRATGGYALLLSFVSGALMALCFAPFHIWPIIFFSLPIFYFLIARARNWRVAAWRGFFFGYGYFMAGTWWIANALLVDGDKFAWLFPLSILGLSAVLGLWFSLFAGLFFRWRSSHAVVNVFLFTVLWVLVEYLRSIGMFGFPWNLAGYIALASLPVAQFASIVGTFGLSFLLIAVGVSTVLLGRYRAHVLLIPLSVLVVLYGYGLFRIPVDTAFTSTKLRLVQPNIPQSLKWTPEGGDESLRVLATLSRNPGLTPDVIIWPETALPFHLSPGGMWPYRLGQLLPSKAILLTGAVRVEGHEENRQLWNSLAVIDARGNWREHYDKHQLVPFGEFMPLRDVLPLEKVTAGDVDFSRGSGVATLTVDTLPAFSPLICYEGIFPWLAADSAQRSQWMVNVTNDAWYGNSPGPYQHFDMVRMRAVEQGLPMVRVANTGISAVIDPYGRIVSALGLGERGVLDLPLPQPILSTIYTRFGEWLIIFSILLLSVIKFFVRKSAKIGE